MREGAEPEFKVEKLSAAKVRRLELPLTWARFNPSGPFAVFGGEGRGQFLIGNVSEKAWLYRVTATEDAHPLWISRTGVELVFSTYAYGALTSETLYRVNLTDGTARECSRLRLAPYRAPQEHEHAVSPDGRYYASCCSLSKWSNRRVLSVRDIAEGRSRWQPTIGDLLPEDRSGEIGYVCWVDTNRLAVRAGLKQVNLCDMATKKASVLLDEARYRNALARAGIADALQRHAESITPVEASSDGGILWVKVSYSTEGRDKVGSFWPREYWRVFLQTGEAKLAWSSALTGKPEEYQDTSPCGRYLLLMHYERRQDGTNMDARKYYLVDADSGTEKDLSQEIGKDPDQVQFGPAGLLVVPEDQKSFRTVPFEGLGIQ